MIEEFNLTKCFMFDNIGKYEPLYDTNEVHSHVVLNEGMEPQIKNGRMLIPLFLKNDISNDLIEQLIINILMTASCIYDTVYNNYSILQKNMIDRNLLDVGIESAIIPENGKIADKINNYALLGAYKNIFISKYLYNCAIILPSGEFFGVIAKNNKNQYGIGVHNPRVISIYKESNHS